MIDRISSFTSRTFARLAGQGFARGGHGDAGVRADAPTQQKYARLTSICNGITLTTCAAFGTYHAARGALGPFGLDVVAVGVCVLVSRLMVAGKTHLARHLLLASCNILAFLFAAWLGPTASIHMTYLAILAVTAMIFDPRDWPHTLFALAHELAVLILLLEVPSPLDLSVLGPIPEGLPRFNATFSVLITAITILATLMTFARSNRTSEARAEAAIRRLDREMGLVQLMQDVAIIANSATTLEKAAVAAAERVRRAAGWKLGRYSRLGVERIAICSLESAAAESRRSVWRRVGATESAGWCAACRDQIGPGDAYLVTVPVVVGGDVVAMLQFTASEAEPPSTEMLVNLDNVGRQLAMVEERVRAQDEIAANHVKMIAAAKMATLGEMAGGIAHEINNPLSVIQGYLARIRRGFDWPDARERAEEAIFEINATLLRITRIVNGLRAFARDSTADPFEPVSAARLVADTLALSAERFRSRGIALEVEPVPSELVFECRPSQISQVLINLLNNAFDAVLDESASPDAKRVVLTTKDLGELVELAVEDCGPGIPAEVREKVLLPFFTTKPVGRGTGLGLSISKGIVESHGGTLEFTSRPGATRFVVILPKVQEGDKGG